MYDKILKMRQEWGANDAKRDAGRVLPQGITRHVDIPYGPGELQKLDIYYPEGTAQKLPTIISIHGGGWFYGSKELYAPYCLELASYGFSVVNFSYRLAPEHKYPAAVEDCCQVLHWVRQHAEQYFIDLENVFTVGDSAGGQLNFQLMTMLTSADYRKLFDFAPPEDFRVRGCGMNCGCYFMPFGRLLPPKAMGEIFEAYLPEDYLPAARQLKAQKYVNSDFPPSFVMTGYYDYLKFMAKPLYRLLRRRGAEAKIKVYGEKGQKEMGHVFHLNAELPLAKLCNQEQCAFFRSLMV